MSTSGVDDCRDTQRNPGAMSNYTYSGQRRSTSKAGPIYVGVPALYRRRKAPVQFGGYFTKTAKDLHRQEYIEELSQQYHRRLHPGPARSTWTYLSSYIRIAGNEGRYLLLLSCPSHDFLPLGCMPLPALSL